MSLWCCQIASATSWTSPKPPTLARSSSRHVAGSLPVLTMSHESSCARFATPQSTSNIRRSASVVSKKSFELPVLARSAQHEVSSFHTGRRFRRGARFAIASTPASFSGTKNRLRRRSSIRVL